VQDTLGPRRIDGIGEKGMFIRIVSKEHHDGAITELSSIIRIAENEDGTAKWYH
jgi:hypothetical protein